MTPRERFHAVMNFQPVDRLPAMEWLCWWDKTLERWRGEGLPADLNREGVLRWYGLDVHERLWSTPRWRFPRLPLRPRSQGVIDSEADYERLVAPALAERSLKLEPLRGMAARQAAGEVIVELQVDGFFWFPREVFGVEPHLYAFYDQPELMLRINEALCEYNLAMLETVCGVLTPDVLCFAEDLSYNHGPMLSREQFDRFLAPFYRRIVPRAKERGILTMVDTDGDMTEAVPWFQSVGIEGCLPLERMAGVDVAELRRRYPKWRMIGGYDKTRTHLGEPAVRAELERLLPVMRTGGYIPSTDHQTPPDVGVQGFREYVRLLHEYCRKAV